MPIDFTRGVPYIRWMIRCDFPHVVAIDAHSVGGPWPEDEFARCLRQRNCIGMVAERADQILAFMIYQLWREHLTLLNFAVRPDVRNQGVGRLLLDKLKYKVCSHRRRHVIAAVREDNDAMHLFLRANGFKAYEVVCDDDDATRYGFRWTARECDYAAARVPWGPFAWQERR